MILFHNDCILIMSYQKNFQRIYIIIMMKLPIYIPTNYPICSTHTSLDFSPCEKQEIIKEKSRLQRKEKTSTK